MVSRLPPARRLLEWSLDLLAPEICAGCDAPVRPFVAMCAVCAASLVPASPSACDDEVAVFAYGGALAAAITSFKYGPRVDRARPLASLLRRGLAPFRRGPPSHVVPVPLHRARLVRRGFNQAALLAAPVARDLGARFAPFALRRTRETPAQASLGRGERLGNLHGAFEARPSEARGARVLLVDDVRTTGATLDACRDALLAAGAAEVRALVLARADAAEVPRLGASASGASLRSRLGEP